MMFVSVTNVDQLLKQLFIQRSEQFNKIARIKMHTSNIVARGAWHVSKYPEYKRHDIALRNGKVESTICSDESEFGWSQNKAMG
jgi:hypothetical protein